MIDTILDRVAALEPRWRDFVQTRVLSIARTEPEIGYQITGLAGAALGSIDSIPREESMLQTFHYLETLRLNACIARASGC